jgi:hypothetical protein
MFMWTVMELALAGANLIGTLLGIELQPSMQMPLFSTTLREFWARRWNLPTTDILRAVVYAPLAGLRSASANKHKALMNRKAARAALAARTVELPDAAAVQQRTELHLSNGLRRRNAPADVVKNGDSTSAGAGSNKPHSTGDKWPAAHSRQNGETQKGSAAGGNYVPGKVRKVAAMMAAFAVSGVIHQWIQHVMFAAPHTEWRWACSFILQPFLIVAQETVQRSSLWRLLFGWSPAVLRCVRLQAALHPFWIRKSKVMKFL